MFGKFFTKDDAETPKRSHRDIVHDFAQIMGQLDQPVLDERLLPHPKAKIYEAFQTYMAQLEVKANYSPESRKELELVYMNYLSLADFQEIDPEDMQIVCEINTGRRFAKFRTREGLLEGCKNADEEDALRLFNKIVFKYYARAMKEQGFDKSP